MRKEIRITGTGGQGIILAGIIVAEASGLFEGKNVVQTQAYGPEARGGASRSEVIISDEPIYFPHATNPDVLIMMSFEGYYKFHSHIHKNTVKIGDSFFLGLVQDLEKDIILLPFTETARKVLGKALFSNIIMLGAMSKITNIIGIEALKKAVSDRVPERYINENMKAVDLGIELAEKWKSEHSS